MQNHACSDHNINRSVCSVPSVPWVLLSVQQGQRYGWQTVGHHSSCVVYRLYCGSYCQCNRARGKADRLLVTIAIVRCTVCTVGLTVSATGPEVQQTIGHYSSCAVYRLYRGSYCQCNRARGTADRLLVTIAVVRCTVCTVGLTVSATGPEVQQTVGHYSNCALFHLFCGAFFRCNRARGMADRLLVSIAIVRCSVCTVSFTVSALKRRQGRQLSV
jgi:hypothetical protein